MKLQKIKEKLAAILLQMSAIKTDKAVLEYDGEELIAGVNVYVVNEDGERQPAEDGEYTTEDAKVIVVKDGKVEAINEPAEEPKEETPKEDVNAEETEPEGAEGTTGEDAPKDEELTEVADEVAKLREDLDALIEVVKELVEKVGTDTTAVEERLSKIEKMSAAKPIDETFENTKNTQKTGDAKLDKQLERVKEMKRNWRE